MTDEPIRVATLPPDQRAGLQRHLREAHNIGGRLACDAIRAGVEQYRQDLTESLIDLALDDPATAQLLEGSLSALDVVDICVESFRGVIEVGR